MQLHEIPKINISFEGITERDMDILLMRKLSGDLDFLRQFFLSETDHADCVINSLTVSHSVVTEDGESDIEVVITTDDQRRVALLIEDKIDAPAMDDQAARYTIRGNKAVSNDKYDEFHVFIVAPEKYLKTNTEAAKYPHRISYESVKDSLTDPFDIAIIDKALKGYGGVALARNQQVTEFWDKVYDFADEYYPGTFRIEGKRGLQRSGNPGQWITIDCNNRFVINIKSDRGYTDLEIKNYADKFETFCKDNKDLIDDTKLFIRTASKSLAIRKYTSLIDFTMPFDTQELALRNCFDAAKELMELIAVIKIR
ncbi:MAG: PD-(D/E)XK nuclease family protein [Firmicutes bacterium]|nr:PD-(D/E)XK nuclease family protein [Bacillota bacterium]